MEVGKDLWRALSFLLPQRASCPSSISLRGGLVPPSLHHLIKKSQRTVRSPLAFSLLSKSARGLCSDVLCSSPNHLGGLRWTHYHPSLSVLYWESQTGPSAQLWSCKCQIEGIDPLPDPPGCIPAHTAQDAVGVIPGRAPG